MAVVPQLNIQPGDAGPIVPPAKAVDLSPEDRPRVALELSLLPFFSFLPSAFPPSLLPVISPCPLSSIFLPLFPSFTTLPFFFSSSFPPFLPPLFPLPSLPYSLSLSPPICSFPSSLSSAAMRQKSPFHFPESRAGSQWTSIGLLIIPCLLCTLDSRFLSHLFLKSSNALFVSRTIYLHLFPLC